ncbi:FadR/GntR family transcriptional regulator [Actinomadura hibisca]|uniref:FadR/GntR family transcriptional regulator n=1 Tax=Actinomadura hibisca TaxID=68565 RepID=UPI00082CCA34|nr:GntR family transcriptional regulator [Actinomadura hibisca]
MSDFQPVQRSSVSVAVFEQIAARIVDGTLPADAALPSERVLTEEFGVNRQALREALQRLDQLGLVEIRHGGATRVRDFRTASGLDLLPRLFLGADGSLDAVVVRSVMEMRTTIGADAAAHAARRAPAEVVRGLRGLLAELDEGPDDVGRMAELDVAFWDLVVEGSGNVCYRLSLNVLRRSYRQVASLVDLLMLGERRDLAAHRELVAGIETGDPERARAAAVALLEQGHTAVLAHLSEE